MVLLGLSSTSVQPAIVGNTSASHGMEMFGPCSKQEEVALVNGPTASACCAAQWVRALDLSGHWALMTIAGPRSTPSTMRGGYMLMLVRRFGISLACIPKVSIPPYSVHFRTKRLIFSLRMGMEVCLLHRLLRRRGNRCHPTICAQRCFAGQGSKQGSGGSAVMDHE